MLQLTPGRLARLRYAMSSYEIVAPGDHVVCAVTGARIPLDELRYWSAERQEAYVDAAASSTAFQKARA